MNKTQECNLSGKIQIRKGVFETNSSSMHSITLADKDGVMERIPLDDDEITLSVDCAYDFQWGLETYTNAMAKIAYCVADEVNPEMLEAALKEQTGAKVIHYFGEGSIDHESYGTAREGLKTIEAIRLFIFNPNSELVIDNDNN